MTLFPFPIVAWECIEHELANAALVQWGHWLGGCHRPFGSQSFGLFLESELVAVAVSASTVASRCAGYERGEVVELARLCSRPSHRDLTRVALRLWRKTAPVAWERAYWPVKACVSYSNNARHSGDLYRFDGWTRGSGGRANKAPNHGRGEVVIEAKSVWVYAFEPPTPSAEREETTEHEPESTLYAEESLLCATTDRSSR